METLNNVLIIPDVHGRPFWKKAVENFDNYDKVIFLGDYLDPYSYEGITVQDGIDNLNELSSWIDEHKDDNKIVLLLGNHDLHYLNEDFYRGSGGCRYSVKNEEPINEFYNKFKNIFKLAYECQIGDKTYLFSHAGIRSEWWYVNKQTIGDFNLDNINALLDSDNGGKILSDVSFYRGGWENYGSIVWADVREHIFNKDNSYLPDLNDVYQIFGHSQQEYDAVITEKFACLDCRAAFVLDSYGLKKIQEES